MRLKPRIVNRIFKSLNPRRLFPAAQAANCDIRPDTRGTDQISGRRLQGPSLCPWFNVVSPSQRQGGKPVRGARLVVARRPSAQGSEIDALAASPSGRCKHGAFPLARDTTSLAHGS